MLAIYINGKDFASINRASYYLLDIRAKNLPVKSSIFEFDTTLEVNG